MKANNKYFDFTRSEWQVILVVAFGYFVDLYDLYIFSAVRIDSLTDLNIPSENLFSTGISILKYQLYGIIIGGLLWGILADKLGRLSVLFVTILTYSIANVLNAFVDSIWAYSALRLIAGIGLAGELGVGLTLVSEKLPRNKRTSAGIIISAIGLLGAGVSAMIAANFEWRLSYLIGGLLGLILLFWRYKISESPIYNALSEKSTTNANTNTHKKIQRGNLFYIFSKKTLFWKFVICIFSGAPAFIFTGIFLTNAGEFAKELGVLEEVTPNIAIAACFFAMFGADVISGLLSKKLRSRKKVLIFFSLFQAFAITLFLYFPGDSAAGFYFRCVLIGIGLGSWGMLITNILEQFGTNLRATVTTGASNLIRGLFVPGAILFGQLRPSFGLVDSGAIVIYLAIFLSLVSISLLKDQFENNLQFTD